jgi:hypothetical protein
MLSGFHTRKPSCSIQKKRWIWVSFFRYIRSCAKVWGRHGISPCWKHPNQPLTRVLFQLTDIQKSNEEIADLGLEVKNWQGSLVYCHFGLGYWKMWKISWVWRLQRRASTINCLGLHGLGQIPALLLEEKSRLESVCEISVNGRETMSP